jgi:hypothetical protein
MIKMGGSVLGIVGILERKIPPHPSSAEGANSVSPPRERTLLPWGRELFLVQAPDRLDTPQPIEYHPAYQAAND